MNMRRRLGLLAGVAVVGLLLTTPTRAFGGTVDVSLIPSDGAIAGPPGSLVGWGYAVTNSSSTDWFVTTLLNADSFANGAPNLLFDFPSVAPGATVSVPYDSGTAAGLYELLWDVGAPAGFVNSGNFVLSSQWWDGDPLNGGSFLFDELDISLPYSATVTEDTSGVPEPSTWWLGLGAIVATMLRGRQSRAAQ